MALLLGHSLCTPVFAQQASALFTAAGSGPMTEIGFVQGGFSGDHGLAVQAQLSSPVSVAVDGQGNIFVADAFNNRIREIRPSGIITTFAGTGPSEGENPNNPISRGDDGLALDASLIRPQSLTVDPDRNVYFVDNQSRIRKIDRNGIIHAVAGQIVIEPYPKSPVVNDEGQLAAQISLSNVQALLADSKGNLYYSDDYFHRVRKIDAQGIVTTVAGRSQKNDEAGFAGDGGPAKDALLNMPEGLALDAEGSLYIADRGNQRIRKVTPDGIIRTVAGSGFEVANPPYPGLNGGFSGDGGPATLAQLNFPGKVAVDSAGNLFIVDFGNFRLRKVDSNGIITTVAGPGQVEDAEGHTLLTVPEDGVSPLQAPIADTYGIALDREGNLYVPSIRYQRVFKLTALAAAGLLSGNPFPPIQADSTSPSSTGVARGVTGPNNAYEVEVEIRATDVEPGVKEIHYSATGSQLVEATTMTGDRATFRLSAPGDITVTFFAVDEAGNAEAPQTLTVRIPVSGEGNSVITTVIGTGPTGRKINDTYIGYSGDGGLARSTQFIGPHSLALDEQRNLYLGDSRFWIRKINPSGIVNTYAGASFDTPLAISGDVATRVRIDSLGEVEADGKGSLYYVDDQQVWRVTPQGTVDLVAGQAGMRDELNQDTNFFGDGGTATNALLWYPKGLAFDAQGNLYIADSLNHRVRKVDTNGIITTVAGSGRVGMDFDILRSYGSFSGDGGPATQATLDQPGSLVVDFAGNLYVADTGNCRIRKITPDGIITTVAGIGSTGHRYGRTIGGYSGDGGLAKDALISGPVSLAVDSAGNLFFSDLDEHVRKVGTDGIITTVVGSGYVSQVLEGFLNYGGFSGDGGPPMQATLDAPGDLLIDPQGNLLIVDEWNYRVRQVTGVAAPGLLAGKPYPAFTYVPPPMVKGDVNQDGKVNIVDVVILLRVVSRQLEVSEGQREAADMNNDGKVTIQDAIALLRQLVSIDPDQTPPVTTGVVEGLTEGAIVTTYPWVTFTAKDDRSGVKEITYRTEGASTLPPTTVPGSTTRFYIPDDGQTLVYYSATDALDNVEETKTLVVRSNRGNKPTFWLDILEGAPGETVGIQVRGSNFSYPSGLAFTLELADRHPDSTPPLTLSDPKEVVLGHYSQGVTPIIKTELLSPTTLRVELTDMKGAMPEGQSALVTIPIRVPKAAPVPAQYSFRVKDANLETFGQSSPFTQPVQEILGFLNVTGKPDAKTPATTIQVDGSRRLDGSYESNVKVTLNAADDGSGIKEIVYRAAGGQSIPETVMPGGEGTFDLTEEGETTLTYFARDFAGNAEAPKVATIRIHRIEPSDDLPAGTIVTLAGASVEHVGGDGYTRVMSSEFAGDGGPANRALFGGIGAVEVGPDHSVYIADAGNNRIRKITPEGIVTTVAGNGAPVWDLITNQPIEGPIGDGGPAIQAVLSRPTDVAVDGSGNLYIADSGHNRIRKVTPDGIITTVAGNGQERLFDPSPDELGDGGPAMNAIVSLRNQPARIALDAAGNLYIADVFRIRKVSPDGMISTALGKYDGSYHSPSDGTLATEVSVNSVSDLAVDSKGRLYFAETHTVRLIDTDGRIRRIAGNDNPGFSGDGGPASKAELYIPQGVAVDSAGNVFIADSSNQLIRKVTPDGIIMTVAGVTPVVKDRNGQVAGAFSGDGGQATQARFRTPEALAVDEKGNLLVVDTLNYRVRKIYGVAGPGLLAGLLLP